MRVCFEDFNIVFLPAQFILLSLYNDSNDHQNIKTLLLNTVLSDLMHSELILQYRINFDISFLIRKVTFQMFCETVTSNTVYSNRFLVDCKISFGISLLQAYFFIDNLVSHHPLFTLSMSPSEELFFFKVLSICERQTLLYSL